VVVAVVDVVAVFAVVVEDAVLAPVDEVDAEVDADDEADVDAEDELAVLELELVLPAFVVSVVLVLSVTIESFAVCGWTVVVD